MKRQLQILLYGLSLFPIFGNAQVCFGPATNFSVAYGARSVASSDFNSDGKKDIAVCNGGSAGRINIFLGIGNGTFGAAVTYTVGSQPFSIICDDFNGDGKIDLAVANNGAWNISVLLGTGTGTFGAPANFSVANAPSSITSADFNGDGKIDLATANNSNNVSVLLGTGTGTFGAASNFAVGTNPQCIINADFNGDGKKDLAIANEQTNNISVLLGTGTGSFGTATNFAVGNQPRSVCSADFDGDGKMDLAAGNYGLTSVSVLLGTGTGSFGGQTFFNVGSSWPIAVISGDFNGDGFADIASSNTSSNIAVLLGTGSGSFGASTNFGTGSGNMGITTADFNGDLKLDLATANSSASSSFSILLNGPPIVSVSGTQTICTGNATTLTAVGAATYSWSLNAGGVTSQTVSVAPSITSTYTVYGTYVGCVDSTTITINVNALPIVNANATATLVCSGTSVTLTGSGANTYTWTGSVINGVSFIASTSQTYTVTGTDLNGCANTDSVKISIVVPPTPDICMVTVDSAFTNNIIYWDKTIYGSASLFYIYRDTANNNYALIGIVSKVSLSEFTDTSRHVGAVNGDPNVGTYRYKIAILDTCGNLSPLGLYHNTVFTIPLGGGAFQYNQYGIEGQSTPISGLSQYILKRDNFNTNSYVTAASIGAASTTITDPQYSTYQTTANWVVETQWTISCTPTMRIGNNGSQAAVVKSRSNVRNNRTTGNGQTKEHVGGISIYPNPTNNELTIDFSQNFSEYQINITNVLGEVVKSLPVRTRKIKINLTDFANGVYFVEAVGENHAMPFQKFVIQH